MRSSPPPLAERLARARAAATSSLRTVTKPTLGSPILISRSLDPRRQLWTYEPKLPAKPTPPVPSLPPQPQRRGTPPLPPFDEHALRDLLERRKRPIDAVEADDFRVRVHRRLPGTLSVDDLRNAVHALAREPVNEGDLHSTFRRLDSDGDGFISYRELDRMLVNLPRRISPPTTPQPTLQQLPPPPPPPLPPRLLTPPTPFRRVRSRTALNHAVLPNAMPLPLPWRQVTEGTLVEPGPGTARILASSSRGWAVHDAHAHGHAQAHVPDAIWLSPPTWSGEFRAPLLDFSPAPSIQPCRDLATSVRLHRC